MSTLMKWRAPREISEENLQRINLQLCSSRDVAYKSHVSEKYVDRNGPYTRCYLSAMSWKIFVFLFFFPFLRSTLRYAKVIIRVKWRKITFDKSAIRSFKQIWFSTRWNFRGEPKISMEKSEGNRESFATWIHPWNSHKSHLEFLFARNFSWLSQLFQSSGMIVSRERERLAKNDGYLWIIHDPLEKTNLSCKQKFVSEQTCIFHGEFREVFDWIDLANGTSWNRLNIGDD